MKTVGSTWCYTNPLWLLFSGHVCLQTSVLTAPTTWVLTSGHEVSDYVIEAGVEGGNTLYVARAYVQVNPHL